ncbi:MAG: hypothetical protein IIT86_11435 [Oscillospiraceae bacterium]|jgi:TRAP-type C4-dicarboxylate transport system permease small subunit|nr:hypothetical protein [Oscillospiraceae bacterium]
MDDRKKQSETIRARESSFTVVRAVVAGYLVYLGFSLLRGTMDGGTAMPLRLKWFFSLLFIVAGLLFAVYTLRRWRRFSTGQEKPETNENLSSGKDEQTE